MSGKSLIDQIRHYQKDIERCPDNAERMIRCIKRLYVLPILVQHLQETGVGRSVNALRKYNGEVGEAAKALVAKWKAMVAAEESSEGEYYQENKQEEEKAIAEQIKPAKPTHSEKVSVEKNHKSHDKKKSDRSEEKKDRDKKHSERHSSSKHKHSKHDKNKVQVESDDSNESASRKKRKKHPSPDRKCENNKLVKKMKIKEEKLSETENESDGESYRRNGESDRMRSDKSDDEDEEEEENKSSAMDSNEEDKESVASSSSSDHKHRSKHKSDHSKSHHKSRHSKSSHSSKEKHHHQKHEKRNHEKHSSSSKKIKSEEAALPIKDIEKKFKQEKVDSEIGIKPTKIKIEKNKDGSIDAGSGASFAEALMVVDTVKSPKKKKKPLSSPHKSEKSLNSPCSSSTSYGNSNSTTKNKDFSTNKHISVKPDDLLKMPELLTREIKVEPLNLDISSTLPEISPHYKPLPHVPETPVRRLSKCTSEEEAMSSIMTTKYQRTKVFSGNKTGAYATVPTLYSICIQLLYDNIEAMEYTGGVPFEILKPLLEKLNADQLYLLEHHNPYLIEDTDNLWEFHCKKDFRGKERQDMESWRDLYLRCVDEREKKLKALTANISQSFAAKLAPVRKAKLAYVDSFAKPPRNIARKQAKYGTGNTSTNKQEIIKKAVVGGHTPTVSPKEVVAVPPPPAPSRASAQIVKKKKAPLMAKALQLIKGNRFKR